MQGTSQLGGPLARLSNAARSFCCRHSYEPLHSSALRSRIVNPLASHLNAHCRIHSRLSEHMSSEHVLQRCWHLYYSSGNRERPKNKGEWKAYDEVAQFRSVEGFWRLFDNVVKPSELQGASKDYFLFEEGTLPDWDDERNVNGGLWLAHSGEKSLAAYNGTNRPPPTKTALDAWWADTVMHVIGEQFPQSEEIVGVSLSLRRTGGRIALWTRNAHDEAAQKSIGREFKSVLQLPASTLIGFSSWEAIKAKTAAKRFYWSEFKGSIQV